MGIWKRDVVMVVGLSKNGDFLSNHLLGDGIGSTRCRGGCTKAIPVHIFWWYLLPLISSQILDKCYWQGS